VRDGVIIGPCKPSSVVCLLVCLSVCHDRESCKNGWTGPDAIWVVNLGGSMELCLDGGSRSPYVKGHFWGGKGRPVVKYKDHCCELCINGWTDQDAVWDSGGPKKHVLDAGANWRHLANTIELSMCGSNAAFMSITLTIVLLYKVVVLQLTDITELMRVSLQHWWSHSVSLRVKVVWADSVNRTVE